MNPAKALKAVTLSLAMLCGMPASASLAPMTELDLQGPAGIAATGTYASPRGWSGQTVVGAIHYYRGMFFEARFNGDPSLNNWYFPTTPTSNAYWDYIDTPVTWVVTSDPQYQDGKKR